MTNGILLRIYTYENRRLHGELVYEWLLEQARKLGIQGGSAFRAIGGFGRHGQMHEQGFFELAGEQPVLVEFITSSDECTALLARIGQEGLVLFHATTPIAYGSTEQQPT